MMEKQKRELTFLSYAHDDLDRVRKVYEGLKKRKVDVWFDKVDLVTGRWKPQIEKKIPKCRYFIFCVSEASLKKTEEGTGFIEEELQAAWKIADAQDEKKFTIVPVRLEECGHGDHRLSTFQQFDLFEDFDKGLDRLAVQIGCSSLSDAKAKDERAEDQKLIDTLKGKAAIAYYSGDYKKALVLDESITELDTKNYIAWYNKGLDLEALGKHKAAIAAYDKAIEIKPDYASAWYNKGLDLYNSGKYEAAIKTLDKATTIKPEDHAALCIKGYAFSKLGNYEAAIAVYDKAIEIKPDLHEAYNNKGDTLRKSGKYKEALKAVKKAIELKPDSHVIWTTKGEVLEKLGRTKEAKHAFAQAEKFKKKP